MESVLSILLLVLLLLVYFSNSKNVVNRRCALAGMVFWLGLVKEAIAYNLLPLLTRLLGAGDLSGYFLLPYSLMTWALYALAMPTAILFALSLDGALPPSARHSCFYLPAAAISCVFVPWQYHLYQQGNIAFWLTFACYNLAGCALLAYLMIRSVARESDMAARTQKRLVVSIILPPVLFWALSAFLPHALRLTHLHKLWQVNGLVLLACIIFYIVVAFRGGIMGLRLTSESYRWTSDMGLIRKGVSFTGHMIKNQTAKMAWCVENLTAQYSASQAAPPEELAILGRAICTLQSYMQKAARYADAIVLSEAVHPLADMLRDAFSLCVHAADSGACLRAADVEGICWQCDRTHMTEVFVNLFSNALEAMTEPGAIEVGVLPGRARGAFTLCVTDHGAGMRPEDAARMFVPYFTTKNSPLNLGLGLAYCRNVVQKHGGTLEALSQPGKGTTLYLRLPASRVLPAAHARGAR